MQNNEVTTAFVYFSEIDINHNTFLTLGPHKTTGRADYFGKVVNRAARITAKSDLGTVHFGVLADNSMPKLS